jgi:hypothetical protein
MKEEIGNNKGEIIIYQSEDGKIRLDVRLEEKTVWLTQEQIAQLYGKGRSTITEHISNIFKEGELEREKVCRKFRHTTQHGAVEGKTQSQEVTLYNLDVRNTPFRAWMNTSAKVSHNSVSVARHGRWPQSAKLSDELPPKCKNCTLEEVAVFVS